MEKAELAEPSAEPWQDDQLQAWQDKAPSGRTSSDDMMLVDEVVVGEAPPLEDALAEASAPSACETDDEVDERAPSAGAAASGFGAGLDSVAGRGAAGLV